MPRYYGDLSSCSSNYDSSSEESSDDNDKKIGFNPRAVFSEKRGAIIKQDIDHWNRSILYLDIDCFYCQCEEIDRNLKEQTPPRPLAIGQKHIIVTCNYEARKYGVKKLQLRETAMAACPDLWIVEGSDLENYRRHSRAVYESFRSGLQEIALELQGKEQASINIKSPEALIPTSKGTMDEMLTDLTWAINKMIGGKNLAETSTPGSASPAFIYGETLQSSTAVLVDDQTGAEAKVSYGLVVQRRSDLNDLPESRRNVHEGGSERDRQACLQRLQIASQMGMRIRQRVLEQTGFTTTVGISVSPLLAKIASGLKKPNSNNIWCPWRSADLIYSMPLRKLHNVGSRTIKALDQSIERYSSMKTRPEHWSVRYVPCIVCDERHSKEINGKQSNTFSLYQMDSSVSFQ
jgi:DNA polymerase iota